MFVSLILQFQAKEIRRLADNMVQLGKEVWLAHFFGGFFLVFFWILFLSGLSLEHFFWIAKLKIID